MSFLRKIFRRRFSKNPQSDEIDILGVNDEYHKLSEEDGGVESYELEEIPSLHCGCITSSVGGRCRECGAISCIKCHKHCGGTENPHPSGCGSPLCRAHAHYLQLPDGRTIPFCRSCHGNIVRKSLWIATGKTLFLPFVEEDGKTNEK
ncbi:hypothetical protein ACFL3G_01910 [Planctomycetota bacterium]